MHRTRSSPSAISLPTATESAKTPVDESVIGIGTYPTYATLFFYRGRELDDGSGLLSGTGRRMRFVRLRGPADARRAAIQRIVRRAASLAR